MNSTATPHYLKTKTIFTGEQLNIELGKRGLDWHQLKDYVIAKSRGKYSAHGEQWYKLTRAHVGALPEKADISPRDWKRIVHWAGELCAARGETWGFTGGAIDGLK